MKTSNKNTPYIIKLVSFFPALFLLFIIFGFSAQDGETSGSLSLKISNFVLKLLSPVLPTALSEDTLAEQSDTIHMLVRKAAHMTEYFLLTLSLHLPMAVCPKEKLSLRKRLLFAFFLTVVFAAADEYHQTFVNGRSGNLTDVGIDSVGAIAATLCLYIFFSIRQRRLSR